MTDRIGINTLFFIPGKVGGTEIFLRELINELKKSEKYNYIIFSNLENCKVFENLPKNFQQIVCPIRASHKFLRIFWEQVILPFQCVYYKVRLLHSPGYTSPIFTHCKKVTTIFDLNYHFHPDDFSKLELIVYKILIPMVAKFSNRVIVHSKTSKKDLSKVLKIPKAKIDVVYPGIRPVFSTRLTVKESLSVIKKYKIRQPYILANAVSHPHKNLSTLLVAFADLVKNYSFSHNLVLLGFAGRDDVNLRRIISEQRLDTRVVFTGWVSPETTPYFYRGADLFVFPSLYEGFGLPLVEAMACGVPLIASNASCIPEVVGKGGVLVDCKNPIKITRAIVRILKSKKLRRELMLSGKKRASLFAWDKFGKEILKTYTKLLA